MRMVNGHYFSGRFALKKVKNRGIVYLIGRSPPASFGGMYYGMPPDGHTHPDIFKHSRESPNLLILYKQKSLFKGKIGDFCCRSLRGSVD